MAETHQKKTRQENCQYWQAHDEGCRSSGLTRQEYCSRHNLNIKTFAYWWHRLKLDAVKRPSKKKLKPSPPHHVQGSTAIRPWGRNKSPHMTVSILATLLKHICKKSPMQNGQAAPKISRTG